MLDGYSTPEEKQHALAAKRRTSHWRTIGYAAAALVVVAVGIFVALWLQD